ncbi:MAG: DUF4286 family protein [Myxococcota bacterium]
MKLEAATPRALFVVFANPLPEHEAEFNRWYDEVHGPDALGNGSFTALHRFRAVGPGYRATPYLALWEAPYDSEAEAWAYIGPRAQALREAGRAGGEVASVRYALMLVAASMEDGPALESVGSLVTWQNDWRDTATAPTTRTWWLGLPPEAHRAPVRWLVTSDAAGRGAGHHLAILAHPEAAAESRATSGAEARPGAAPTLDAPAVPGSAAGMSPLPPYHTIFGTTVGSDETSVPRARAWRMVWEPVISQRA